MNNAAQGQNTNQPAGVQGQQDPNAAGVGSRFKDDLDDFDINWNLDSGEMELIPNLNGQKPAQRQQAAGQDGNQDDDQDFDEDLDDDFQEPGDENADDDLNNPNLDPVVKKIMKENRELKLQMQQFLNSQAQDRNRTVQMQQEKPLPKIEELIPEGVELSDILADRNKGLKFLGDVVNTAIAPLVRQLRPMIANYQTVTEMQNLMSIYGSEDVKARLPLIQQWCQQHPGNTLETAYLNVRNVPLKQTKTKANRGEALDSRNGNRPNNPQRKVMRQLNRRADRQYAPAGVGRGSEMPVEHAKTVRQAFNSAVEEHSTQ